jgi:hypothetical protein
MIIVAKIGLVFFVIKEFNAVFFFHFHDDTNGVLIRGIQVVAGRHWAMAAEVSGLLYAPFAGFGIAFGAA